MPSSDRLCAIVLAAGRGTRLRPLTDVRPKALCPVNNVALVDLALARVRPYTEHIAVNVHHGRDLMEAHLAGRVHLSIEDGEPLGTAGGVARLRDWVAGRDVIVANADAWHTGDLDALVDGGGDRIRLLVVERSRPVDFGPFEYAGAAYMPWAAVRELPDGPAGLYEASWRPRWQAAELDLVPGPPDFIDCGTPARYLAANLAASGGQSVVGAGAVVEGELIRSVVWPGALVARGERLVDAIRVGADLTVCPTQE